MASSKKNPASGFLIMATFNGIAMVVFLVLFVLANSNNWDNSILYLVAGIVSGLASVGSVFVYKHFSKKFERIQ